MIYKKNIKGHSYLYYRFMCDYYDYWIYLGKDGEQDERKLKAAAATIADEVACAFPRKRRTPSELDEVRQFIISKLSELQSKM